MRYPKEFSPLLRTSIAIAQAAATVLRETKTQGLNVRYKQDQFDPVTKADLLAEQCVREALTKEFPKDGILSEESPVMPKKSTHTWLVDPLDGTRYYIEGSDAYTVLIGRCTNMRPTLGVVVFPERDLILCAQKGKGAYRHTKGRWSKVRIKTCKSMQSARLAQRTPKELRPLDLVVNQLPVRTRVEGATNGDRILHILEGKADVMLNTNSRASKWDTCAWETIIAEAGGKITSVTGKRLDYDQKELQWADSFLVCAKDLHKPLVREIRKLLP